MNRVAGSDNAEAFHQSGLTGAINILAQISRYRDLGSLRTMLDWGCGCGRLSARMVDLVPHVALTGCDIDGEAIAWNKANFRNASFLAIEPYPPTPLPPASFDVVFGSSVMTHLTRQDQKLWIDEIHRILKPGGLFLSSVHGEFAASFFSGAFADLKKMQIIDARLDTALDGIAPPGYYRATFQTENFTRKHWGGKFRILDYVQAGLCSFQDLVLMEPR
jgi:SAM-dependent methyltransferase